MKTFVHLTGWVPLGLVGLVLLVLAIRLARRRGLDERNADGKVFRLQLVRTVGDVEAAVGDLGDPRRAAERRGLRVDYGFIAFYSALFLALSVLLTRRAADWGQWLGYAAGLAAIVGALSDIRENLRTERVLETRLRETTPEMVRAMAQSTRVKWAAIVAAVAALSGLFWGDGRDGAMLWFGVAFGACAAIGALALLARRLLAVYFVAIGLTLLATAVLFAFCADVFLQGF
jgi:hypothetical protein